MFNKFEKSQKGFTLAELLIAIFVLTTGIIGIYIAIQQSISVITYSYSRLTAAYLAQEGIEIIRNIKDTNLLEKRSDSSNPWNENLEAGDWEAEYSQVQNIDPALYSCPSPCDFNALRFLRLNGGFYNYASGDRTKFKRKISITRVGDDILKVQVTIYWQGRQKVHNLILQENLYNWW
jgi:prepilin-type N-terminal cleavage/methylation domain-containing protein